MSIPVLVSGQDTEREVQNMNAEPQRSQRTCLVPFGPFGFCIAPGNLSIQPFSLCISQFTQIKISLPSTRTHLALTAVKPVRKAPQRWLFKEQDPETKLSYRADDSFSFAHITSHPNHSQARHRAQLDFKIAWNWLKPLAILFKYYIC